MAGVTVQNRASLPVAEPDLVALARFLIQRLRLHPRTELAISFVDAEEMSSLHERWMDEPGPTDVLSFPMDELRVPPAGSTARPGVLGDVVICPQVAADQARIAGHSTAAEIELLLTHGVLHLLGHDHAEPEEHSVMFGLQAELLASWREART